MENKIKIIGKIILILVVGGAIGLGYSQATLPTLKEKAMVRKAEIETRQVDITSMANFYRQAIKNLQAEHDSLQQEKDSLNIIINPFKIIKYGVSNEQNTLINYAYDISNNIDFIYTIEAESSAWSVDKRSKPNTNGTIDVGICQLNTAYHKTFIDSEDFKNPYKQIDYCWAVFKDGVSRGIIETTFYGYNNRGAMKNRFNLLTNNK